MFFKIIFSDLFIPNIKIKKIYAIKNTIHLIKKSMSVFSRNITNGKHNIHATAPDGNIPLKIEQNILEISILNVLA